MRALVTNDDGIGSAGLSALAGVAADAGLEVVVAAPAGDASGAGASLRAALEEDGRLLVDERGWALDGVAIALAVDAAPAFIVRAAMTGAFGPLPDVVLSGVNHGPNTGHAVLHSGTVGAALTAASHGRPALAVSVAAARPRHWDTASLVAAAVLRELLAGRDGEAVVLNVNVPDVTPERLAGVARARLAAAGAVQATVQERGEGWVKLAYEAPPGDLEPGTDAWLVARDVAAVTPLQGVCEALRPPPPPGGGRGGRR